MIRAFDRLYRRRPNVTFTLMATLCAIVLYIAYAMDKDNSAAPYWQVAAQTRSST
jgi:hypothetical protein